MAKNDNFKTMLVLGAAAAIAGGRKLGICVRGTTPGGRKPGICVPFLAPQAHTTPNPHTDAGFLSFSATVRHTDAALLSSDDVRGTQMPRFLSLRP